MHYIAALDVGTTTVRCFVLNETCEIKGSAVEVVSGRMNPKTSAPKIFMNEFRLRLFCMFQTCRCNC